MAMLMSLAAKIPLRGAVTIGAGVELEARDFYGPALAEAHHLEGEVADRPRIVVSDKVRGFLAEGQVYSHDAEICGWMQHMAGASRSLLCEDTDGRWIVDFLGKGIRGLVGTDSQFPLAVRKTYEFVRSEAHRFRTEGPEKLALRYQILQEYVESRVCIWGLNE